MARRMPSYFPTRINLAVRSKTYTGNIEGAGIVYADLGAPVALGSTIGSAQSIAAAGTFAVNGTIDQSDARIMGRFGRAVSIVASGTATEVITINGRDYLGQPMKESITLNSGTAVLGNKAFRYVDSFTVPTGTGGINLTITTNNKFGVPHKFVALVHERKDGITAANAGVFVVGLANATAATATNADVRGTYLPATVLPDGVRQFELRYIADETNLDGNAQFNA